MILDRDSMRCFEELEYLVNFAFDQSNYEPTHPGDFLNVSVAVDSVFQEFAIFYAKVNDAWQRKDDTRDTNTAVCHLVRSR